MTTKNEEQAAGAMVDERTVEKDLMVKLTPAERLDLGNKLAEMMTEAERLEVEKSEVTKDLNAKIERAWNMASAMKSTLRQGAELRKVQCTEIMDYREGTVTVIRKDTMECVSARPMKVEERQVGLRFEKKEKAAK